MTAAVTVGNTSLLSAIRGRQLYWKLTCLKNQPILAWLAVGTIALGSSYLAGRISGEWLHPWLYVYFSYFIVAGIPLISIHALDLFSEIEPAVQRTFGLTEAELHDWLLVEGEAVFGFHSRWMWASSGLIVVLGDITIIALRHHVQSPLVFWGMLVSGQVIFFLCGHGAYAVLKLMQLQYRFARLPLGLTFLQSGKRAVDAITRPFNFMSFAVLAEYVGLLLAVTLSPFRSEPIMSIWLLALAASPILSYSWSLVQTHILQAQIKYFHLDAINVQVESIFQEIKNSTSRENLERLAKVVEIQRNVEQGSEWPISPQIIFTLGITAAAAISQFLAAWSTLVKLYP